MAKIKLDPIFAGMSGTMGDIVFRRSRNGETIISKRPRKSKAKPSEAQKAQRQRLTLANAYAKAALADPTLRVFYEELAAKQRTGAFAAARNDYLKGNDLLSEK